MARIATLEDYDDKEIIQEIIDRDLMDDIIEKFTDNEIIAEVEHRNLESEWEADEKTIGDFSDIDILEEVMYRDLGQELDERSNKPILEDYKDEEFNRVRDELSWEQIRDAFDDYYSKIGRVRRMV